MINIIAGPYCSCGAVESTKHFLLECPVFDGIIQNMLNEITSSKNPTIDILLHVFGNMAMKNEVNSNISRSV